MSTSVSHSLFSVCNFRQQCHWIAGLGCSVRKKGGADWVASTVETFLNLCSWQVITIKEEKEQVIWLLLTQGYPPVFSTSFRLEQGGERIRPAQTNCLSGRSISELRRKDHSSVTRLPIGPRSSNIPLGWDLSSLLEQWNQNGCRGKCGGYSWSVVVSLGD